MTQHILDHPRSRDAGQKAKQFSRIAADTLPRPQSKNLQQRTRKTGADNRLKAFAEIERRR